MASANLVIRGKQVVLPGAIGPASVHINGGAIAEVTSYQNIPAGCELAEADDDSIVMPGLVDTHVHINEPGRSEWEGFATATRAAAAGGVTTVIDMPLNSIPPTTTLAGFKAKLDAAEGKCFVDVGFWGGVIPGNTSELAPLKDAGVVGFKCFMVHSGVEEFPDVTEADLRVSMPELKRLDALLIVHAEVPGPINEAAIALAEQVGATKYQTFLESRPREAENQAIALVIKLASEFETRVHVVHHSSADALPLIADAKAEGVKITAETCPHYLSFTAEEIPDGATEFKCCPPIREQENREQLWDALADQTIDMIVSDHSPCPPDMKLRETGNFLQAWGGISSLELRLPAVWTEAQSRGFSIQDLSRWLCREPARLVGLHAKKGSIAPGYDADIVIWSPNQQFQVEGAKLHHRHKLTPYEGLMLQGVVETTFLRGQRVFERGRVGAEPVGNFLRQSFVATNA